MNRHRFHPERSCGGFALLMTLVLLAVAAVTLAGVARQVNEQALEAARAQRDLQLCWGWLSCRDTLLPQAEAVMAAAEAQTDRPVRMAALDLRLGDQTFRLCFTDEQAKVNINTLHDQLDLGAVHETVYELVGPQWQPLVRLEPIRSDLTEPGGGAEREARYQTLGQVFLKPPVGVEAGHPALEAITPVTGNTPGNGWDDADNSKGSGGGGDTPLTCWGDGRINIHRADREVLTVACRGVLTRGQVEELIRLRDEQPGVALERLIAQSGLTRRERSLLAQRLREDSACHGLWVVAPRKTGQRQHTWFAVAETSTATADEASTITQVRSYRW